MPEAVGPSSLVPGIGRLLIEAGMLDASPQMPQGRLRVSPTTRSRGP